MQFSSMVAVVSLIIALVSILVSAWVVLRQTKVASKDLTLIAYSNAVQGILGLKDMFKQEHELFDQQIRSAGLEGFLPKGMNSRAFLTFTNGFWRFSYVFSVMEPWEELGLTKNERDGLEREMRLWLEEIPGFREVYNYFIKKAGNNNPTYLEWLESLYNKPKPPIAGSSVNGASQPTVVQ